MFTRTTSLILITKETLARVDLIGSRMRVGQCWQREIPNSNSLATLVASGFKLGPSIPSRVWVLNSEFANHTVTLPLDVTVMLSGGELERALAIEAEAETGLSATTSHIAAIKLAPSNELPNHDEHQQWWVTQIDQQELESMRATLSACGARLIACAHPAALQVTASGLEPTAKSECSIDELALAWADALANRHARPHSIQAAICLDRPRRWMDMQSAPLAACLLLATGLGWMAWDKYARINDLNRRIAACEQTLSSTDAIQQQNKQVTTRLTRLRDELTKTTERQQQLQNSLNQAEAVASQLNASWPLFLDAIASAAIDECWIRDWSCQGQRVKVSGLATDRVSVHRLASRLEQQLSHSCWQVSPAELQSGENDLISFSISVEAHLKHENTSSSSTSSVVFHGTLRSKP